MVKGNWQRRAELAAARRAEEKIKKESKKGNDVSLESVAFKLLNNPFVMESRVECWLLYGSRDILGPTREIGNSRLVCSQFLRKGVCNALKKCKLNHDSCYSLAAIRGIELLIDADIEDDCEGPMLLSQVPKSTLSKTGVNIIRFIAVDGRCVFDYSNRNVWSSYCISLTELSKSSNEGRLSTIYEQSIDQDELMVNEDSTLEISEVTRRIESIQIEDKINLSSLLREGYPKFQHLDRFRRVYFPVILSFLTLMDIFHLMCCSKEFKSIVLANENVRDLRKAAKQEWMSKLKAEKRKKQINAFIKPKDKIDAFSRGMALR